MKHLVYVISVMGVLLGLCACNTGPPRPAEYPQDLTAAEVAAIPEDLLYEQSDSVLIQWAATYPEELAVWGWIRSSLDDGGITPEQASRAVDLMIAWMRETRPEGYRSGLGHRGDLIGAIERRDGLRDDQLRDLAEALHGPALTIEPENDNGSMRHFHVYYGSTWSLPFTTNMPHQVFWQIAEVRIDGEPVEMIYRNYHPDFVRVRLEVGHLPPGEHTIEARIAIGITEWRVIREINRRQSSPADWPEMRMRWELEGSGTFRIEPQVSDSR